jgi:hypothetical protein
MNSSVVAVLLFIVTVVSSIYLNIYRRKKIGKKNPR